MNTALLKQSFQTAFGKMKGQGTQTFLSHPAGQCEQDRIGKQSCHRAGAADNF